MKPKKPKPLTFSQLVNQVTKQTNTLAKRIYDFDGDGVPNWKDCQPLNPRRQDREKPTSNDYESIKKSLLSGSRKPSDLTYSEFAVITKAQITKTPFIKVVRGYGISKQPYPGSGKVYYYATDMKTGLCILSNRESLEEIIDDIKRGVPEQIRREDPETFSVRAEYESMKRGAKVSEKYSGRSKTFKKYAGQKVLDIGAGDNPDVRATHAIDLEKPDRIYPNLSYKWGYDFNKETTSLPYNSNSFDVVVSLGALGRNFESAKIYREIYRVLKPGGRFEYSEPWHPDSISHLKKAGFGKLQKKSYFNEYLKERIPLIVAKKV